MPLSRLSMCVTVNVSSVTMLLWRVDIVVTVTVFVNVNVSESVDVYKYRHDNVDAYQDGVTVCQFQ